MNNQDGDLTKSQQGTPASLHACPYCGHELSPWEQVLLAVDRLLLCKSCRRTVMLNVADIAREPHS